MIPDLRALRRRAFLGTAGRGVGAVALASLLGRTDAAAAGGALTRLPLPRRAKRVIWLTMAGGPSHLETFDPKPKLAAMHGQPMPESFTKGQQLAQLQGQKLICQGPQFRFRRHGRNGTELSELLPHLVRHADIDGYDLWGCPDELLVEAEQGAAEHVARVARRPHGVKDRADAFDGERGERIDGITAFLEMKTVWHPIGS